MVGSLSVQGSKNCDLDRQFSDAEVTPNRISNFCLMGLKDRVNICRHVAAF